MDRVIRRPSQTLLMDSAIFDKDVAKCLPPEMAFAFHVLPLAIEQDCLTIAMADPEDKFAIQAVASTMGHTPYVVRSDQNQIDQRLIELWPNYHLNDFRILLIHYEEPPSEHLQLFVDYVCKVFGLCSSSIRMINGIEHDLPEFLRKEDGAFHLIAVAEQPQTARNIRKINSSIEQAIAQKRISVLIAREPRHPFHKILMILDGDPEDHICIDWMLKIPLSSNTEVVLFLVVPPLPGMYQGLRCMSLQKRRFIAGDSALAKHVQCIVDRLESHGLHGSLRLREGTYKAMIRQVLNDEEYDLISIAAGQKGWLWRFFLEDPIHLILRYSKAPILIARSPYQDLRRMG